MSAYYSVAMGLAILLGSLLISSCAGDDVEHDPQEVEISDPDQPWNSLIEYWGEHEPSELPEGHASMAAVIWFDSEVQNGGLGQYFHNNGFGQIGYLRTGLETLDASQHAKLLETALSRIETQHGPIANISDAKGQEISDLDIDDLDSEYSLLDPTLTALVEAEVTGNEANYRRGSR